MNRRTFDHSPRKLAAGFDPVLDSIFSALGVDEDYLDNDECEAGSVIAPQMTKLLDGSTKMTIGARPWILHVDDDAEFSNALKMRLEPFGVSVVLAFDGMDGVQHAFNEPADAIILDYHMPHGNGEYVLRRLRQCEATKRIPIIVLTGRRDQDLEQHMLSLGANRFLNKPVRFDKMLDVLREFVALREPRGEACLMP